MRISLIEQAADASTRRWSLSGKNRLVKVVPPGMRPRPKPGYVTQERFLAGLNSHQIERDLGLKPMMLRNGADIYTLQRLPHPGEFEFKLSTAFPGGSVFNWDDVSEEAFKARDFWPPGASIPQWNVTGLVLTKLHRTITNYEPY